MVNLKFKARSISNKKAVTVKALNKNKNKNKCSLLNVSDTLS